MDIKKAIKTAKIRIIKQKFKAKRALVTAFALSATVALGSSTNAPEKISDDADNAGTHVPVDNKITIDLNKEIEKRAEWMLDQYLEANNQLLDDVMSYSRNPTKKAKFIKDNIFDFAGAGAGLEGTANYCIAAINAAWRNVDSTATEVNRFTPPPLMRGKFQPAVRCLEYRDFLVKQGFGEFISTVKYKDIDFTKLNPGDIIMEPRIERGSTIDKGYKHATTFTAEITDKTANSFNLDGKRDTQEKKGDYIVYDMKGIASRAILLELENENLIQKTEDGFNNKMTPEDANKLMAHLYRGRDSVEMSLALAQYTQKIKGPTLLLASAQMIAKNKNLYQ